MPERLTLEDVLQEKGLISEDQVSSLRLEQLNRGCDIDDLILEHGWVKQSDVFQAKAEILGVDFTFIDSKSIDSEVSSLVPESVARQYTLIPFKKNDGLLFVAMEDPLDLQVKQFLETKTGLTIKPFLSVPSEINSAIEEVYRGGMESEVRAALKETEDEIAIIDSEVSSLKDVEEEIKKAPVARIVSTILQFAVKSRTSDVHIEPQDKRTRVRYRVDGILREKLSLPKAVHPALISRIKILSNLKIDESRIPQDGRFPIHVEGKEIDLRVSTLPTAYGEKVVMRLLEKGSTVPSLVDLGLRGRALKDIEDSLKKTRGIILITGPTGSGKTTTLRTSLEMINSPQVNIITLEDPVEYAIKGINQVQINPQAGLTFASGLRSILRQDPDIIMVGEIRDSETMNLAIQASLTGHLVFSTIHTNSAAGAIPRMMDMGAESFLLASTIETIVAQRLVRTLCPKCREKYEMTQEIAEEIKAVLGNVVSEKDLAKATLYHPKGCTECGGTGYVSRVGIYEVLRVNDKISQLIMSQASMDQINQEAVDAGMMSMLQDGFLKVLDGTTCIEEVLRVAHE